MGERDEGREERRGERWERGEERDRGRGEGERLKRGEGKGNEGEGEGRGKTWPDCCPLG